MPFGSRHLQGTSGQHRWLLMTVTLTAFSLPRGEAPGAERCPHSGWGEGWRTKLTPAFLCVILSLLRLLVSNA